MMGEAALLFVIGYSLFEIRYSLALRSLSPYWVSGRPPASDEF